VASLPGVEDAVRDARDAVDGLLGHRVLRRQSGDVSAESALRGAVASAALDGSAVPLDAVRRLAGTGESLGETPEHAVLRGAMRTSAELGGLAPAWERAPLQALARLHVLAAADLLDSNELGRPQASNPGVSARLDALARLVTSPTAAPAVVVAAVVHAELLAVRPFAAANGVVARAAQRLVLITRGLDPKSLCVPEVGHLERASDYVEGLRRYETGTPEGVAAWVIHCAGAVALGAREGLAICEALRRGMRP
jgi:hypothetical protein